MAKGGRTKNLRYGALEELESRKGVDETMAALFGDQQSLFKDDVQTDDMEDIYEIDIDVISDDANTLAAANVQNLLRLYNNKEFTDNHPDFKRRIDTEIESLRKLYKMSKINETVHDHLVGAIAKNPGNASLYMSLDKVQGKILSIDEKIRDQINNFNKIVSAFQLELNFSNQTETDNGATTKLEDGAVMARGNKAFIEQMKSTPEPELFETESGEVVDTDTGEIIEPSQE